MSGVEFSESSGMSDDDDLLEGPGGRTPRWLWVVVGVVVLALIGAAAVAKIHSAPQHRGVAASTNAGTTAPSDPNVHAALGAELRGLSGLQVIDLAQLPGRLIVYQRGVITIFDTSVTPPKIVRTKNVPELSHPDAPEYGIVTDSTRQRIWLVAHGDGTGQLYEFGVPSLDEQRSMQLGADISSAGTYAGHLWLGVGGGIADLGPDDSEPTYVGLDADFTTLPDTMFVAVDATRNRILGTTGGPNGVVFGIDPASHHITPLEILPFIDGRVIVVDRTVWAVGLGRTSGLVVRLDPLTFTPIHNAGVTGDRNLGNEADIVTAGTHSLWIRANENPNSLWCLDGVTGNTAQYWDDVSGPVTSVAGSAYAVAGGRVVQLPLDGCVG